MEYRQFERNFLRIAFTTKLDLTPAAMAFVTGTTVARATEHMQRMVDDGILELDSDDEGHLRYSMPDRPSTPLDSYYPELHAGVRLGGRGGGWSADEPTTALVPFYSSFPAFEHRPTPAQAALALFLNGMVCPGVGSMVGGKTATGIAQLTLFLVGLPLAIISVGLPLIMTAWIWSIVTGAQLVSESQNPRLLR